MHELDRIYFHQLIKKRLKHAIAFEQKNFSSQIYEYKHNLNDDISQVAERFLVLAN